MKKLLLIAVMALFAVCSNAQSQKYLNLGGVGTGLYFGMEYPLGKWVTIGPQIATNWEFNSWVIAAKGNYYFDDLFGLPPAWDVYLGANGGWRIDTDNNDDSGINFGAQVGGRWFWSEKFGLNGEFGGGTGVTGGVGITMKW